MTNDIDDIKKMVQDRVQKESETGAGAGSSEKVPKLSTQFVMDCLYSGELGNGILFSTLYQGKFIYNKTEKKWFVFNGHHWEPDIMDQAYIAVEGVVEVYLNELDKIHSKKKEILKKDE